jgi:hypothetical protein
VLSGTNQIFIGANNKTTIINGVTNINTTGSATTTIGNILSTTNISGSSINMSGSVNINTLGTGNTTIGNGTVNINTTGTGNTIIGNATGSAYTAIESNRTNIGTTGLSATGYVNIATGTNTTGSEVFMGSTSLTKCYIRAGDVNINHLTGGNIYMGNSTSGTTNIIGNVTLGANALTNPTAQSTNITIGTANSAFRLYTPITIGYGIPGSAYQIGGVLTHSTIFDSDSSPTYTGFAYLNNVPPGRYICNGLIYYSGSNPAMWIYTSLALKSSAIGFYQSGLVALGDNALETFSNKINNVDRFSINPTCVYSFSEPNNNVALGVQSSAWSAGLYTKLMLTRIG